LLGVKFISHDLFKMLTLRFWLLLCDDFLDTDLFIVFLALLPLAVEVLPWLWNEVFPRLVSFLRPKNAV